jgi:predicted enzyme related to lactoylglutathione lyase
LSHLAFRVNDVTTALQVVLSAGGSRLGEVVSFEVPGAGVITFTYARDPEGNIIELQSWSSAGHHDAAEQRAQDHAVEYRPVESGG